MPQLYSHRGISEKGYQKLQTLRGTNQNNTKTFRSRVPRSPKFINLERELEERPNVEKNWEDKKDTKEAKQIVYNRGKPIQLFFPQIKQEIT